MKNNYYFEDWKEDLKETCKQDFDKISWMVDEVRDSGRFTKKQILAIHSMTVQMYLTGKLTDLP